MKNVIKTTLLALALTAPMAFAAAHRTLVSNVASPHINPLRMRASTTDTLLPQIPKAVFDNKMGSFLDRESIARLALTTKQTTQAHAPELAILGRQYRENRLIDRATTNNFARLHRILNAVDWVAAHQSTIFSLLALVVLTVSKYCFSTATES